MNISGFLLTYNLSQFKIEDINVDQAETHVTINDKFMTLALKDFVFKFLGELSFWTTPAIFYGNGTGNAQFDHLNSSVDISFGKGPNDLPMLHLHRSQFDLDDKHMKGKFQGTNDVFQLLDLAKNLTFPMIIEFLNGTMTEETMKQIESTVNDLLAGLPSAIQIPGTDVVFNYGLLFAPDIKNGAIPFGIEGTSKCANATNCKPSPEPKPKEPPFVPPFEGPGTLQIKISDYLLNSFLRAVYENGLIHIAVTPEMVHNATGGAVELNTELFSVFIPEMKEYYGKERNVTLDLHMTAPPTVDISEKEIGINSKTWTAIYVNNSNNELVKAFDIEVTTVFKLDVKLSNYTIKGNISEAIFSLDLKFSDIKDVKLEELNELFRTLFKIAIPQINSLLNDGIKLPDINIIDLSKSDIHLSKQFLHIGITPEPKKGATLDFDIKPIIDVLTKSYKKVRAVKAVEAIRPVHFPEWLHVDF